MSNTKFVLVGKNNEFLKSVEKKNDSYVIV